MDYGRSCYQGLRDAMSRASARLGAWGMTRGVVALILAAPVAPTGAQQPATAGSLVFDGVTVVDVDQGKLIPDQRVVIVGNRIRAMGRVGAVKVPQRAQVVDARGKYLIPGLWDMHAHVWYNPAERNWVSLAYPLFLAHGVTGIRDAGSLVPLDSFARWRGEIAAGRRVGPPRQVLSGPAINDVWCQDGRLCIRDSVDARRVVDSIKAAGADMIKTRVMSSALYFRIAAEARRSGLPFGGHAPALGGTPAQVLPVVEALSDSGARTIDHMDATWAAVHIVCGGRTANVAQCELLAKRFRRNGTWVVPTLSIAAKQAAPASQLVLKRRDQAILKFWADSLPPGNWLRDTASVPPADSAGYLDVAHRVGLPILAGTDGPSLLNAATAAAMRQGEGGDTPGLSLHAELAIYVAEGLSPLEALQSATLNPAKMLHATDSLGTIAPGKLADLVLLDANPLADITNTTTIRAAVANGRYFDRATLDRLLDEVRAEAK